MTAARDRGVAGPAEPLRRVGPDGVPLPGARLPEELDDAAVVELHGFMLQQRVLDRAMVAQMRAGAFHRYPAATGQEAAIFGAGWALSHQDWVFPSLREHGVARMRGSTIDELVAQCFANVLDHHKGRQRPTQLGAPEQQLASPTAALATHLLHAVGAARGMGVRGSNAVVLAFHGAAATGRGDAHAAFHQAGRARLPVVFMCVRNLAPGSYPFERHTRAATVADRVRPYGIRGVRVDGADVFAVFEATRDAVARARRGAGPTLVEALTWRLEDPAGADEGWRVHDPIARLEAYARRRGVLDSEAIAQATQALEGEIDDVLAINAVQDPVAPETLFDDVLAHRSWALAEQAEELDAALRSS
ncbi:MAG: 3-methyl-2-oxobutanoate dehydrogenase [Proteobacteria bacterium]|nr:MAG: 3-methyl-2-oxobutanoate dehydrogenase [Pseudomonadota bacterium]